MESRRNIRIGQGYPLLLGANRVGAGYNFSVEVPEGAEAALVLYRKGSEIPTDEIEFPPESRTGGVCSLMLVGLLNRGYEYNFRVNGKIMQDPCAYGILGKGSFGDIPDTEDEHKIRCRLLPDCRFDWSDDRILHIPYHDMILYKIHVRGYTKQYKISPKKRGTFSGLKEMIPYWKELGINAVELMPAYEFSEIAAAEAHEGMVSEKRQEGRVNFWGYVPGYYFAPKRSYCATKEPEWEFKDLIMALHKAGIECIMEFYFPKEISPLVVLRAIQFWKMYYHVDGFHLLGEGVPAELLMKDSLLTDTKLMMDGIWMEGNPRSRRNEQKYFAEYNPGFLENMRRFLKSDEGMLQAAEYHIKKNPANFAAINYMSCQDGFTLADMVTYNYKHNEDNGEENRDGSSYNHSWNCGVEGSSRKLAIRQIRERQMRNAFLLMLLSQGVPMIYGGDEICNSQNGNNNAYCQDNPIGWIDWKGLKKNAKMLQFVKEAIAFRKEHPILHMEQELKGVDYRTTGFPDISFHGERAWYLSYENTCRLLGVMYCGSYAEKEDGTLDEMIYVAYNFHWETRNLALPNLPEGLRWKKIADTSETDGGPYFYEHEEEHKKMVEVAPRTIVVLVGR